MRTWLCVVRYPSFFPLSLMSSSRNQLFCHTELRYAECDVCLFARSYSAL